MSAPWGRGKGTEIQIKDQRLNIQSISIFLKTSTVHKYFMVNFVHVPPRHINLKNVLYLLIWATKNMWFPWCVCPAVGTCVHPWWVHVDIWQNQYNIVK